MVLNIKQHAGFTLSELLISLSVLGLISALTLPAVFNSVNDRKRIAVFKETINALASATTQESNNNARALNTLAFVNETMNVVSCNANMTITAATDTLDRMGCVLQNGAYLLHLDQTNTTSDAILVDWNGNDSPNTLGNDRMIVWLNWSAAPLATVNGGGTVSTSVMNAPATLRPGEVLPRNAEATLFTSIFK